MERLECNSLIISDFVVFQLKLALLIFLVGQDESRCNTCIMHVISLMVWVVVGIVQPFVAFQFIFYASFMAGV